MGNDSIKILGSELTIASVEFPRPLEPSSDSAAVISERRAVLGRWRRYTTGKRSRIRDCPLWCRFQSLKKKKSLVKHKDAISDGSPLLNLELGTPAIKSYGTRITMHDGSVSRADAAVAAASPLSTRDRGPAYDFTGRLSRVQYLHEFCDRRNLIIERARQRISRRCYIVR